MSTSRSSAGKPKATGLAPVSNEEHGGRRHRAGGGMRRRFLLFLARRLAQAALAVVLIAIINFLILQLAPGDAVDVLAGEAGAADPGYVADLRQRFGLDQPLPVQLGRYLLNLARLDLGYSFRHNMPVGELIIQRLPATLLLMVASLGIAFIGGIVLGATAARKVNSLTDNVISVLALLAYATPLFWLGLMLLILFTLKLNLLPGSGMVTIGVDGTILERGARRAAPSDPAGNDAVAVLHGDLHAADARFHAGGLRHGLRSHPLAPRASPIIAWFIGTCCATPCCR